jgi:hypothetical protein
MIDPPYGGELLVDFTSLRPRGLALAFARGLFMLVAPRGPIMVRSSIKTYVTQLPSFFAYLAGTGDRINGPADLRAHHIDGFERWLAAQGKSRTRADLCRQGRFRPSPHRGRSVPSLSIPACGNGCATSARTPTFAPSTRCLQSVCRPPAPRCGTRRSCRDRGALAVGAALTMRCRRSRCITAKPTLRSSIRGCCTTVIPSQSLYKLRKKRDLTGAGFNLSLHAAHYLTADDIVPLLVLLSLETGLELECCKSLTIDCLRNASGGTVDIAYTKLRAHGAEHKTIRVRDRRLIHTGRPDPAHHRTLGQGQGA